MFNLLLQFWKQFDVLEKLLREDDVEKIVCATDAGREGELIFRLVYDKCECRKPVKRLWISSMEESAIREGFAHLRDAREYDGLYNAALCRARADWLVGINMTRLLSTMYGHTLNVGRVMSPTLSMIAQREKEIASFVPEPFYTVQLSGEVEAMSEKMKDQAQAEAIAAACMGKTAVVRRVERREKRISPPKLYDLTTLQREANRMFGFTAQQTLDYAQALYEKRLLTYPRTDSRFLPAEMGPMLPELVKGVAAAFPFSQNMLLPVSVHRVINPAKVTDHHAIIPTYGMPRAELSQLTAGERTILAMVAARLLCAVGDAHRYEETEITLDCAGHRFVSRGRCVTNMGWKIPDAMFRGSLRAQREDEPEKHLPDLLEGMTLDNMRATVKKGMTKAPERYTEDALLLAMERAGAEEGPESAAHGGIGTPATRAGIIEKLVKGGFVMREGEGKTRFLVPTEKGKALAEVLPEKVKSAEMTAEWEKMLALVEHGDMTPEAFMDAIARFVREEVASAAPREHAAFPAGKHVVGVCPRCGAPVVEAAKGYFCDSRDCRFAIWKDNRFFQKLGRPMTREIAEALIREGRIDLTGLHSSKSGKSYDATIVLSMDDAGGVRYGMEFPAKQARGE